MSHTSAPASPEAGHEPSRSTSEGHLTVGDVVALVEAAAPPGLAASWDSNGLICGDPAEPVRSILLAVDPVTAVVDEAIDAGVDMVITHPPLYLRGTDHVAATDPKGRTVHRLIRAGIALLNAHTSLDAAHGGVADALAERVGLVSTVPLEPDPASPELGIGRIGTLPQPPASSWAGTWTPSSNASPSQVGRATLSCNGPGRPEPTCSSPPTCATTRPPSTWRTAALISCAEPTGPPSGSAWSPWAAGSQRTPTPVEHLWLSGSPALSRTPGRCACRPEQTGHERIRSNNLYAPEGAHAVTSAPIAQQRLLIDLQDLDSHLARLRHERKHLPVLTRIEAVIERLKANKRAAIQAEAALDEAKKQATRSEDEVGQVARRAEVLRERLHSGTSAARDLSAIQGEIDQLGQRQSALEEAQIVAMEALDSARQEAERLSREEAEIRAAGRDLTAKRDAEFARLDEEIESLENQRADLAGTIEAPLLADYEAVRSSTGGLGAVALRGRTVEGGAVEISPQELARIVAAPAEDVIHAEENDVIVVRMDI